jgi:Insulinase (Peptidase family M16)
MINNKFRFFLVAISIAAFSFGQTTTKPKKPLGKPNGLSTPVVDIKQSGSTYEFVLNDPLKTRIYTLKNGMKVYMSVYKNAPRIQTYIAVRAGSKNDPANATGLAHYLEHMVFKGTDVYGTRF